MFLQNPPAPHPTHTHNSKQSKIKNKIGQGKLLKVMDTSITLITVTVLQAHAYYIY